MRCAVPTMTLVLVLGLACGGVGPGPEPVDDERVVEAPSARPDRQREARPIRPRPGRSPEVEDEPASEVEPAPSPGPAPAPAPPPGIRQVSADTWEVARATAERWKGDPSLFAAATAEGPGWRLQRVRSRDGWHVGFRNGDIVTEVNGHRLGTLPEAMMAYAQLKDATDLTVRFRRDGKVLEQHYRIR